MLRASSLVSILLFALATGCAQTPTNPAAAPSPAPEQEAVTPTAPESPAPKAPETKSPAEPPPAAKPPSTPAPVTPAPVAPESSATPEAPEDLVDGYVTLAQFTTEMEDGEPMNSIAFLDNEQREIIFFSEAEGFAGTQLIHRWEYKGQVMVEVPFEVDADPWQGWSSKQLMPEWVGDWTVSVVKPDGEVIAAESFSYSKSR